MSGLIKDWLPEFLNRHRQRFSPHDWPDAGTEDDMAFGRLWFQAFMDLTPRVREEEADTASVRLGARPPRWRNDHLPQVMIEILAIREAAAVGQTPTDRASAEQVSQGCRHCGGSGYASVFHRLYVGEDVIVIEDRRVAARVAAHCVCPMGRWMRGKIQDLGLLGRIPDYPQVLSGRSDWLVDDPRPTPEIEVGDMEGFCWREMARRLRIATISEENSTNPCHSTRV